MYLVTRSSVPEWQLKEAWTSKRHKNFPQLLFNQRHELFHVAILMFSVEAAAVQPLSHCFVDYSVIFSPPVGDIMAANTDFSNFNISSFLVVRNSISLEYDVTFSIFCYQLLTKNKDKAALCEEGNVLNKLQGWTLQLRASNKKSDVRVFSGQEGGRGAAKNKRTSR